MTRHRQHINMTMYYGMVPRVVLGNEMNMRATPRHAMRHVHAFRNACHACPVTHTRDACVRDWSQTRPMAVSMPRIYTYGTYMSIPDLGFINLSLLLVRRKRWYGEAWQLRETRPSD